MKKVLSTLLIPAIMLTACNNSDDNKSATQQTSQLPKQPFSFLNHQENIDVENITHRTHLDQVIKGNYSDLEKLTAYNSAVANRVIPQSNVIGGSVYDAYQSSIKIEQGIEAPPSYHMYNTKVD